MTNFDYVQKTIDLFEDSLRQERPLTTACQLAGRIGYSSRHLGRLFHSLCGEPLGRYLLRRRLAEAAALIRDGGISAAEASVRLGWEDYSSFSRAVRREFGVSPGALKGGIPAHRQPAVRARPRLAAPETGDRLNPILIRTEPVHLTGMVFHMGPNEKTFHRPWRIFCRHRELVRGIRGTCTWQVSSWSGDDGDSSEGIWIHCAVETDPAAAQDPVFFSRLLPAGQILRFEHSGPVEQLYSTYRAIWEDYLPRSTFRLCGNSEYQRYPDPENPGLIEICLPVTGG